MIEATRIRVLREIAGDEQEVAVFADFGLASEFAQHQAALGDGGAYVVEVPVQCECGAAVVLRLTYPGAPGLRPVTQVEIVRAEGGGG